MREVEQEKEHKELAGIGPILPLPKNPFLAVSNHLALRVLVGASKSPRSTRPSTLWSQQLRVESRQRSYKSKSR